MRNRHSMLNQYDLPGSPPLIPISGDWQISKSEERRNKIKLEGEKLSLRLSKAAERKRPNPVITGPIHVSFQSLENHQSMVPSQN